MRYHDESEAQARAPQKQPCSILPHLVASWSDQLAPLQAMADRAKSVAADMPIKLPMTKTEIQRRYRKRKREREQNQMKANGANQVSTSPPSSTYNPPPVPVPHSVAQAAVAVQRQPANHDEPSGTIRKNTTNSDSVRVLGARADNNSLAAGNIPCTDHKMVGYAAAPPPPPAAAGAPPPAAAAASTPAVATPRSVAATAPGTTTRSQLQPPLHL